MLGWAGPLFWPYAYGNATVRVVAGEPAPDGTITAPATATAPVIRTRTDVCKTDAATSLTAWPIEQIAQAVEPTDAQRTALDNLRTATARTTCQAHRPGVSPPCRSGSA